MSSRSPAEVYVDAMLGEVAKWLRFYGVKVIYYDKGPDEALLHVPILFSADRELCRRAENCFLLKGKREEKVAKALCLLGLPPRPKGLFCMLCASSLKEVVASSAPIPEKVKAYHKTVYYCPYCNKYYWKGSHWKNIEAFLKRVEQAYSVLCRGEHRPSREDFGQNTHLE